MENERLDKRILVLVVFSLSIVATSFSGKEYFAIVGVACPVHCTDVGKLDESEIFHGQKPLKW